MSTTHKWVINICAFLVTLQFCTVNETSDKSKYPTFARTRPPITQISKSVASVLTYFNWTSVSFSVVCRIFIFIRACPCALVPLCPSTLGLESPKHSRIKFMLCLRKFIHLSVVSFTLVPCHWFISWKFEKSCFKQAINKSNVKTPDSNLQSQKESGNEKKSDFLQIYSHRFLEISQS